MALLTSKTILITGGTGSFGHCAVKNFLEHDPRTIVIYSRDEFKQGLMRTTFKNDSRLAFLLGDVRDKERLISAFQGVDLAVHAAALKQIPACEDNASEAVLTNVMGIMNLIAAANSTNCHCVINLSADKAAYSTSVYGATKLLSEKLMTNAARNTDKRFINIRYSNVFDSRGGVFEVFRQQLAAGERVTVLDRRARRFFLTQQEVVDLCLFAIENGLGGETYVKKASPVNILQLAQTMSNLFGAGEVTASNNESRPGDKLEAVLLTREESRFATISGDLIIINSPNTPSFKPGQETLKEQDYTVDDFPAMEESQLENLVRQALN